MLRITGIGCATPSHPATYPRRAMPRRCRVHLRHRRKTVACVEIPHASFAKCRDRRATPLSRMAMVTQVPIRIAPVTRELEQSILDGHCVPRRVLLLRWLRRGEQYIPPRFDSPARTRQSRWQGRVGIEGDSHGVESSIRPSTGTFRFARSQNATQSRRVLKGEHASFARVLSPFRS
jgi:hypothetical protein